MAENLYIHDDLLPQVGSGVLKYNPEVYSENNPPFKWQETDPNGYTEITDPADKAIYSVLCPDFDGKDYLATSTEIIDMLVPNSHFGLHLKMTFNSKGDLITIEWYKDYDDVSDTYTNLAIKELRTYTRDPVTGLVTKNVTDFEYYLKDGTIGSSKQIVKWYNSQTGYTINTVARGILIRNRR